MATTTPNFGLTKPAYGESADVIVINNNMDILDTAINERFLLNRNKFSINKGTDWDALAYGVYSFNNFEAATGGNGYPDVSDMGLAIIGRAGTNVFYQIIFGRNTYGIRLKSNENDAFEGWIIHTLT